MALLGVGPGPVVGEAYNFLLERRIEDGPMTQDQASELLRQWWAERGSGHE